MIRRILLGHSWGSYLGLLTVRERPDLYEAFIGTGVIAGTRAAADSVRRDWIVRQAEVDGDSALLARLAEGGTPSEDDALTARAAPDRPVAGHGDPVLSVR